MNVNWHIQFPVNCHLNITCLVIHAILISNVPIDVPFFASQVTLHVNWRAFYMQFFACQMSKTCNNFVIIPTASIDARIRMGLMALRWGPHWNWWNEGRGEPTRAVVPWRQGFRHPTRNECMGWFTQIWKECLEVHTFYTHHGAMPGDLDSNGTMDNLFSLLQSSIKAWEGPLVYWALPSFHIPPPQTFLKLWPLD